MSVTQNTITLNFDADYTVGQFVNGDYYIVAPSGMVLTSTSPASVSATRDVNGCMVNPSHSNGQQGYDEQITWAPSSYAPYNASLNAVLDASSGNKKTIPVNSSLVCVRSQTAAQQLPAFTDMAVFTVLSSAPPAGSFRPGYMGTDKTIPHNISDIDYSKLGTVTPASNAPTFASIEEPTAKVWYEAFAHWVGRYFRATNNVPIPNYGYGSNMATVLGQGLLLLNSNYSNSTKQKLLYQLLQYAIDIENCMDNGVVWPANGGHGHGRKTVLTLGGVVFNDAGMKAKLNYTTNPTAWAEDTHLWVISSADYSRTVTGWSGETGTVTQYSAGVTPVGTVEWGWDHISSPTYDNAARTATYRDDWGSNIAGMLSVLIMGGKSLWARPETFDYAERFRAFMTQGTVGVWGTYTPGTWVTAMYDTYWSTYASGSTITCYPDADNDLYPGSGSESVTTCSSGYYETSHFTAMTTDCNDNNANIKPGATDTCGNGIDEDCSGADAVCPVTGPTGRTKPNGKAKLRVGSSSFVQ